ncbi:tRNA pseudouridine synthase A [Planoprotostelium fungivorum]|uniref:tRNA pseudouridine synthase n=1 Tax=Planoprotostelium fungivorum TaxID=1890364 RepID=A0A2P6N7C6_9EUKA|nr:tRNA pseudouridine synthase A [Planoprotostelium fungivorum]
MQRFRLDLAYCGTRYNGWSVQTPSVMHKDSIQSLLENAAAQLHKPPVRVYGCSRTDAGVHALHAVAHIDLPQINSQGVENQPEKIRDRMRHLLRGSDILIKSVQKVDLTFHAQHSAIHKRYVYKILNIPRYHPARFNELFNKNTQWVLDKSLDLSSMSVKLTTDHGSTSTVKNIQSIEMDTQPPPLELSYIEDAQTIQISISGDSFLKNQVRAMVGGIVEVGMGKTTIRNIEELLSSGTRNSFSPTIAPAAGLYLQHIEYPESPSTREE